MSEEGQVVTRPPRVAEWMLRAVLRGEAREVICGDLEEEYRERTREDADEKANLCIATQRTQRGRREIVRKARWWYWRQAVEAILVRAKPRLANGNAEHRGASRRKGMEEGMMGTFWQDVKFGARMLAKSPGMTVLAVVTLALGVGANATVFNWLKAALIEPLPGVERQGELVGIFGSDRNIAARSISYPNFKDMRERSQTTSAMLGHTTTAYNLADGGRADRVFAEEVTENFFDVLGVRAQLGRTFTAEEGKAGAAFVAVISDGLWKRKFGGAADIVGKEMLLNGNKVTVVGVAEAGFGGAQSGLLIDLWVPIAATEAAFGMSRLTQRGNSWMSVLARRRAGVSTAQVQAEMIKLADDMAVEFPQANEGVTMRVFPLWKLPRGATAVLGPVLLILMGLAAVVLLIACANVANMLLSRALGRRREMAIRLSLGASRLRIVRQLLIESGLLSAAGGVLAVAIATGTGGLLMTIVPPTGMPIGLPTEMDWRLLGFTMAVAMFAAILFGLAPAMQASRAAPVDALKEEAGSVIGGRRGWLRNTLVVVQVALSVVLLVSAGLFVRSLKEAQTFEPGFNPRGVVLASVSLFSNRYSAQAGREFVEKALARMETMPGVKSATVARRIPLGFGGTSSTSIEVAGYTPRTKEERVFGFYNQVGPRYFETLQIPLVAGRDFRAEDKSDKPLVMAINEEMARRYWNGRDPIGQKVTLFNREATVIAVVKNTKMRELKEAPAPIFYLPVGQFYGGDLTFHVKAEGQTSVVAGGVRQVLQELDGELAIFNPTTLDLYIGAATFQQKMAGTFLTAFGALALTLAAVGIFGVMAYAVSQRTHEIGVRMALGAKPGDVFRLVMRQGTLLLGIGVGIGLLFAVIAAQFMKNLLFGVSPLDPVTLLAVPLLLAVVTLVACWVPALRATRVDPVVALRYE